jgi:hypothetical protein
VWKLTNNKFPQIYLFAKIYAREKNEKKEGINTLPHPRTTVQSGRVNQIKGANLRTAAENLRVERPERTPRFIEENIGSGER